MEVGQVREASLGSSAAPWWLGGLGWAGGGGTSQEGGQIPEMWAHCPRWGQPGCRHQCRTDLSQACSMGTNDLSLLAGKSREQWGDSHH